MSGPELSVRVLAQVPAEAAALPETIASLRRLGDVTVYDVSGDDDVARAIEGAGVARVELEWRDDFSAVLNEMLADGGDRGRFVAYADEIVEDARDVERALPESQPGTARVRHRTSEADYFDEDAEVRYLPPGDDLRFEGRFPPVATRDGRAVDVDSLPELPLFVAHAPYRWAGLAEQRIARTIGAVEAALEDEPGDAGHLYALLHCHVSLHDWPRVADVAARWRDAAREGDDRSALVDYYDAFAALRARRVRRADALARAATERAGAFADAWYLRGELARILGDERAAADAFERAASLGLDAHPVAVEDFSLSTWRPLLELAALARARGDDRGAAALERRAHEARERLRATGTSAHARGVTSIDSRSSDV